jgi:hypothetical protein
VAELKVGNRLDPQPSIKAQRAVDIDLLCFRVYRERIAIPEHEIGCFTDLNTAGFVTDAKGIRRILGQPTDRMGLIQLEPHALAGGERLGRFLV